MTLRVLVSAACIAWVLTHVQWMDRVDPETGRTTRGFLSALGSVFDQQGWPWLVAAAFAYTVSPFFGAVRWRMLLNVQQIRLTLAEAWKLTYIGFFYNTFLLGVTGGDLVKAWYAAKHTERKTEAVTTVFLDRLIGIFGLALLCVCALAFRWSDPALADVRRIILIFIAASVAAGIVLFSRRVRRWLHVQWLIDRLPFGGFFSRLDAAVIIYRDHVPQVAASVVLSWCAHVVSIASVYFSARALGLDPSPYFFLIYMPIIWIAAAILPTVGGLGAMEGLATIYFTADVLGVASSQTAASEALAMMLIFRLAMFAAVIPGGVLHAVHPEVSVAEARRKIDETEPTNA